MLACKNMIENERGVATFVLFGYKLYGLYTPINWIFVYLCLKKMKMDII